jgi:capsular polysaccharide transport system permease protein
MKVSPSIRAFDAADPAASTTSGATPRRKSRVMQRLRKWRGFLLFVVLPTMLATIYFYGIAAGQYASEAHFLVRGRSAVGGSSSGLMGGALASAGFKPVQEEAMAVRDFLESQDAVRQVRQEVDLVSIWRRPEADLPAMLATDNPTIEKLVRYYNRMVTTEFDSESGTLSLLVKAFRPEDSQALAEALLRASEALVNRLSERQREDTLNIARSEVAVAEQRVIAAREALTRFRQDQSAVDPTREMGANMENVGKLETVLSDTRAELREKLSYMRSDNPQIGTLRNRIAALETQIAAERRRLTAGEQALPQQLAGYERLLLEREFADRQLAAATAGLESARVDAARQQLYVARVVEPRLAESAEYPRAAFIISSIFAVLAVVYGIASLMLAGFREHAA